MFTSPLSLHYTGSSNQTETHDDVTTAVTHVKLVLDSLTPAVARSISPEVHDLCFTKDGQIHDSLSKVTVRLRKPQQAVTAKMAADVAAHVVLRHVRVPTLVITKRGEDKGEESARKSKKVAPTAETLRATLNCLMLPESNDVRAFLCQMAGKTFYFEFEPEEKQLDFGPDAEEQDDEEDESQEALEFGAPRLNGWKHEKRITDAQLRDVVYGQGIELSLAHVKALSEQQRIESAEWVSQCKLARSGGTALPSAPTYLLNPAELGIAPPPDPAAGDLLDDQPATPPRAPRRSSATFKNSPRIAKPKKAKK